MLISSFASILTCLLLRHSPNVNRATVNWIWECEHSLVFDICKQCQAESWYKNRFTNLGDSNLEPALQWLWRLWKFASGVRRFADPTRHSLLELFAIGLVQCCWPCEVAKTWFCSQISERLRHPPAPYLDWNPSPISIPISSLPLAPEERKHWQILYCNVHFPFAPQYFSHSRHSTSGQVWGLGSLE